MSRRVWTLVAVALIAVSCASPARLARRSGQELAQGDVDKAYELARKAVEKDAGNADARAAYARASERLAADWRGRIRAQASADSLAAAEAVLRYTRFRSEVAAHGATTRDDADWAADEGLLYRTAASRYYRQGREALAAKKPKTAWRAFGDCRRFLPEYADVERQQDRAWRLASVRVALMPFADGVDVPGLALDTHRRTADELAKATDLVFTRLVDADSVEGAISLAESRALSREAALAAAKKLGAQRVVIGRFLGLRSSSDSRESVHPLVHRVEVKDDKGATQVQYEASELHLVTRSREVRLTTEMEVVDVKTGTTLARRTIPGETFARVVWTDFRPVGDIGRYALMDPDRRKSEPDRAKDVDARWKEQAGSWTVPALLQRAKDGRDRERYKSDYRREFVGDTRPRPVWLGELPGEDELAFCAVNDLWRPVLAALEELDAKE